MDLSLPVTNDERIPLPPPRLRFKVVGTEDVDWFVNSGRLSVQDLTRALASIGRSFDEFNDLLEWGCGCGRILRHMSPPHSPRRIYGNDIDQEALLWINENLSWVETSLTSGMPPLPYADSSFDLIFNHSVLTYLDVIYQDAWLAELKRVLRPSGIAILTVNGLHAFQKSFLDTLAPEARIKYMEDISTDGILYLKQDGWADTDYFPDFYHTSFHDIGYISAHWSKFLNLRSYIPRGALDQQDMIVLQNPAGGPASRTYYDYQEGEKNDLASTRQELGRVFS